MVDRQVPPLQSFAIEADATERAALAKRLGLLSLESLNASGTLETITGGKGGMLRGRFRAHVTQACIVTLEPVPAAIEDGFSLDYAVAEQAAIVAPKEVDIDLEVGDPPEPLVNGRVDVGEVVAEHLALALDPYPRAPGVEFEPKIVADTGEDSPFKVLSRLVKKDRP